VSKPFAAKLSQLKKTSFLPIKVQEEVYFKSIIASVTHTMGVCG